MTNEVPKEKKPRSKKLIIISVAVVILLIGCVSFYFAGKGKFTPEREIMAFEHAVKNESVKELTSLLHPHNDLFKVTEDNTKKFLSYLKDNPDAYKTLVSKLNKQAEFIKTSKNGSNGSAYLDDVYATVNLSQKGKEWLIFSDYQLEVVPAMITLYSDNEDVDLLIDDEKVATSPKKEGDDDASFGPFMPGTYKIKAAFDNTYASIDEEEEIDLFNTNRQSVTHNFDLPLGDIEINSLYGDFDLYVDDKKTDITIDEGKQSIGTFPNDGSVVLDIRKDYPWGVVKSDEKIIDSDYLGFDTLDALSEEDEIALMEQINDTVNQYHVALSKKDPSLLKDGVTDNMKKDFKKILKKEKKKHPKYKGNLVRAIYNINDISNPEYDKELSGYTMTLDAHYTLHEPVVTLGYLFSDKDKKEYTRSKRVTVFYDEEAEDWKLDKYDNDYFIISSKDEMVFEYAKNKKKKQ